jgi:hypothetical protein
MLHNHLSSGLGEAGTSEHAAARDSVSLNPKNKNKEFREELIAYFP